MKKIPAFFSEKEGTSSLEKAQKDKKPKIPKQIKLQEGANAGRIVNVVHDRKNARNNHFGIVPRPGSKPLKVVGTEGPVTASDKSPVDWDKNRAYKVVKNPKRAERVFDSKDLHGFMPHSENQKKLVEGIDLGKIQPSGEGWSSEWAISGFTKNKHGKGVVVKGRMPEGVIEDNNYGDEFEELTTAQREGLYHNIANFMGLGKYVPTTSVIHDKKIGFDPITGDAKHGPSGNHYSVMEKIPGARHYARMSPDGDEWSNDTVIKQSSILRKLHDSGELHKLAIMNAILGNTDRHGFNFMISPKGLHLIDHGLTIDHNNKERSFVFPGYLRHANQISGYGAREGGPVHENAKKWLMSLNHDDMKAFLESHKLHSKFKKPILNSLLLAQDAIKSGTDSQTIGELLKHITRTMRGGTFET